MALSAPFIHLSNHTVEDADHHHMMDKTIHSTVGFEIAPMETKSTLVALGITKAPKGNLCPTLGAEVHMDGPDYLCQTFCKLLICIMTNKVG